MRGKRISLGVGLATLALSGVGIADTESRIRYNVVDLGSLSGSSSWAASINSRGEVVGESTLESGEGNEHAFLWTQNLGMIDLGTLGDPSLSSSAEDLNDAVPLPQVVGSSEVERYVRHAFVWQDGIMTDLGVPGGQSQAMAINNHAQVVGDSDIPETGESHAVLWEGGSMVDLGTLGGRFSAAFDINEAGQVVGWSTVDPNDSRTAHAFLWENGVMTDVGILPGGQDAEAQAVNEFEQIVGFDDLIDDYAHCFGWVSGRMFDLGNMGDDWNCLAYDINNRGVVVGEADSVEVGPTPTGFLWRQGLMVDLNTLTVPGTPWEIRRASGVNDLVMIAADGSLNYNTHALLLVPQRFNP